MTQLMLPGASPIHDIGHASSVGYVLRISCSTFPTAGKELQYIDDLDHDLSEVRKNLKDTFTPLFGEILYCRYTAHVGQIKIIFV